MSLFIKKKKQLFLSHCSSDKSIINDLYKLIQDNLDQKWEVFFTSDTESNEESDKKKNIHAGKELGYELRESIRKSECMCAIITDNYLRSPHCIAELSACWYRELPLLPIVFSEEGEKIFSKLFGQTIFVDAKDRSSETACKNIAKNAVDFLIERGISIKDRSIMQDNLAKFFFNAKLENSNRPFIGGEYIADLVKYCDINGITNIRDKSKALDEQEKAKLIEADEIYFLMTTGQRLVSSMVQDIIPAALNNGCTIHLMLPNKGSDFCLDVARIETPETATQNFKRITEEFDQCINLLQSAYNTALAQNDGDESKIGKVFVHCSYTILRQTIFLAVKKHNQEQSCVTQTQQNATAWGWITMTMPPKRAVTGTPSLDIIGNIELANNTKLSFKNENLAQRVYNHLQSIILLSHRNGDEYPLTKTTEAKAFRLEKDSAKEYWKQKRKYAQCYMLKRQLSGEGILIEVAAQHPLNPNGTPDEEFSKRLDMAIELYKQKSSSTNPKQKVTIYVPGSLHMFNGVVDKQSLSDAGIEYLKQHGIPEEDLIGDIANVRYKGDDGVYNSADECYVAAKLFLDDNYSELHCVCSPAQIARKILFYLEFGVEPYFHSVSCSKMFHNIEYELLETLPRVLLVDHSWQSPNSIDGIRTRKDRKPTK